MDLFIEIAKSGGASVVVTSMTDGDIRAFYAWPWTMVSSDGGIEYRHPRGAGTFPRVLGRFVRERGWLTLEDAIRKMTSLLAWRLGLKDRGTIKPGYVADLVLFDPATVVDHATFAEPFKLPPGLKRSGWVDSSFGAKEDPPAQDQGQRSPAAGENRPGVIVRGMKARSLAARIWALALTLTVGFSGAAIAQTKAPAPPPAAPKAAAPKPASKDASLSDPDVAAAKKAALDWIALVDAGKYPATFDEAAASFQKAQKKDEWAKGLGEARRSHGKLLSRTFVEHEVRTALPNLPPGKYITIRFKSSFEKQPDGKESVTCVADGARGFRMVSYFLQ